MDIKLRKQYGTKAGQSVDETRLFGLIASELTARGIARDAYRLANDPHVGFGELRLECDGPYWVISTEERGEAFNPCVFLDYFEAVNFFLFELTGSGGGDLWKKL